MLLGCSRSRFSQHSTFEGDKAHPPQLSRSSFSDAPDSARVSETGTAKAADGAEKSKRKGRFQIVEEDPSDPGKRGVGRSTSVASMDSHRSAQVSFGLSVPTVLQRCNLSALTIMLPLHLWMLTAIMRLGQYSQTADCNNALWHEQHQLRETV